MKVLTQVWRAVRLFSLAFVAQLAPLLASGTASATHITWALAASAGVAAAESVYRQYWPAGKNGIVAKLVAAYKAVSAAPDTKPAAPPAPLPPVPPATPTA